MCFRLTIQTLLRWIYQKVQLLPAKDCEASSPHSLFRVSHTIGREIENWKVLKKARNGCQHLLLVIMLCIHMWMWIEFLITTRAQFENWMTFLPSPWHNEHYFLPLGIASIILLLALTWQWHTDRGTTKAIVGMIRANAGQMRWAIYFPIFFFSLLLIHSKLSISLFCWICSKAEEGTKRGRCHY